MGQAQARAAHAEAKAEVTNRGGLLGRTVFFLFGSLKVVSLTVDLDLYYRSLFFQSRLLIVWICFNCMEERELCPGSVGKLPRHCPLNTGGFV